MTAATLKLLVTFAYDVRPFQVSGGPGWIDSDRFEINARAEHSEANVSLPADPRQTTDDQLKTSLEQVRERLRNLLADRFQLRIHREAKEQQVYALVVAKDGPKLQPAKEGRIGIRTGRGSLSGRGVDVPGLARGLSDWVGRTVVDKTGLTGNYDIELKWATTVDQSFSALGPPPGVESPPLFDPNGPSLFTAVQEQLGLRLESQKGPVETLVIDRAEKPSEN